MKREGIPFVISAPSGTGKTTICKILRTKVPHLQHSVSHTTREPRKGETHGSDYHYISEKDFKEMTRRGEFLEWAKVHRNYYGTARSTVEAIRKNGDDILLELDVQGAKSLRQMNFQGVFIFILPPSLAELENRLKKRCTEPEDKIRERLDVGKHEISQYTLYDYVVTNYNAEEAADNILAIINSEKHRSTRYVATSPDIQSLLKKR